MNQNGKEPTKWRADQEKLEEFEPVFYPKTIAIVGASRNEQKMGSVYLNGLLAGGFEGKLFPVNPKTEEIMGVKAFPSVSSIPDPVDYVIITVPRDLVLDVLEDCALKKVRVVQIFTAGFSETGAEEGNKLEEGIIKKADKGKFRIIGPNCIGVFSPKNKMRFFGAGESGFVAFISQSGGHVAKIILDGMTRELQFSKIVSFGNGCDLNDTDFLEYLAIDPETKIIGIYLEGTKDGKKLFKLIKETSKIKPVVVWKGGRTDTGAKAAASHTGSLAGSYTIWNDAVKQAGAVNVESFEELVDTLLAFQFLPKIENNNVALIGGFADGAGGASVAGSDACASAGLNLSPFSKEIDEMLNDLIPLEGSITVNPLDLSRLEGNLDVLSRIIGLIDSDPRTDIIIINEDIDIISFFLSPSMPGRITDLLIESKKVCKKPMVVVSPPALLHDKRAKEENKLSDAKIPVYPSIDRAAKAIMNVITYWRHRSQNL
jgi:acyl-CoA synthetase (NDP forming)